MKKTDELLSRMMNLQETTLYVLGKIEKDDMSKLAMTTYVQFVLELAESFVYENEKKP